MKNKSPKTGFGAILGSLLGVMFGKKRDQNWSQNMAWLGLPFGGMLADLGMHFGLDFGTCWAWEGEQAKL